MKRLIDVVSASLGLLVLWPLLVIVAVLVRCTSRGPALFRQERMGRNFRPFRILKFRTMVWDAPQRGGPITIGADPRITRFGRILRKTKVDELPQLINVLKGDMSLVGPRPEVPCFVEMFRADYAEILQVRPGITDLASIRYRDESTELGTAAKPDEEYRRRVLPEKIRFAKEYVERRSLWLDLTIIFVTLFHLVRDRTSRRPGHAARTELHQ